MLYPEQLKLQKNVCMEFYLLILVLLVDGIGRSVRCRGHVPGDVDGRVAQLAPDHR